MKAEGVMMTTYIVTIRYSHEIQVEYEAETPQEACEKAKSDTEVQTWDCPIESITVE